MALKSKLALDKFLEVIKIADNTFLDPDKNLDEQGHIDGYNHLFHLMRTSIDFFLLNDPLKPSLKLLSDDHHKMLGDNVDAVYYFTQLRSDQEYVISGKRFDSCYLSFSTYSGDSPGEIVDRVTLNINQNDIEFEADGSFNIKLTPNPNGKNEFKIDEDVVSMFTREYFFDRFNSTESQLKIENISNPEKTKPLSDDELAKRIDIMSTFFEQSTWIAPLPVEFPTNAFLEPFPFEADQGGFGTVDNVYCFGKYKIEEDEYLKINFTSPECCYWGLQTWNYLMQSMDYANYNVCLNKGNTKQNQDGSYTIYLSHREMDVDNWISAAGYNEAIMFCRWLLAEELPKEPTVELCRF